jgi:hypothetical protein
MSKPLFWVREVDPLPPVGEPEARRMTGPTLAKQIKVYVGLLFSFASRRGPIAGQSKLVLSVRSAVAT